MIIQTPILTVRGHVGNQRQRGGARKPSKGPEQCNSSWALVNKGHINHHKESLHLLACVKPVERNTAYTCQREALTQTKEAQTGEELIKVLSIASTNRRQQHNEGCK